MALSTVPITATLVILLSPRRRQASIPFLAGWMLSISVIVLAAGSGTFALRRSLRGEQLTAIAIAGIVLGGALVISAIVAWRRSGHAPPTRKRGYSHLTVVPCLVNGFTPRVGRRW